MAFRETNSEGKPIIKLTDEERYMFDLQGWVAVPGVLEKDEIAPMVEHCRKLKFEKEDIPLKYHTTMSGPLETLCDHPKVVGFMQEFVGNPEMGSDGGYGFRMEYSFMAWRLTSLSTDHWRPHAGMGSKRNAVDLYSYRSLPGDVFSGFVQAVWELTDVERGDGTHFVSGSHKGNFDRPDEVTNDRNHPAWDTYECPAGSIVFFSESTCHSGSQWSNPDHDRCAIFNTYNSIYCRYHNWEPHPEHLAEMNPVRASLFRPVYREWNQLGVETMPEEIVGSPRRGF